MVAWQVERLAYHSTNEENGLILHRYWTNACQNCSIKRGCTTGKQRRIIRWEHEHVLEAVQRRLFVQRLRAMGIRDRPIAPRSPWQNAYVERLIGSIRRECLDHMIVFGEAHLRRILGAYATYYNESRSHRSLNKDAPFQRAIQRLGAITSQPVLGGLHHQCCRI